MQLMYDHYTPYLIVHHVNVWTVRGAWWSLEFSLLADQLYHGVCVNM